jgi:hypothetical protein
MLQLSDEHHHLLCEACVSILNRTLYEDLILQNMFSNTLTKKA